MMEGDDLTESEEKKEDTQVPPQEGGAAEETEAAPPAPTLDMSQYNQCHSRFKDKAVYDIILTQLVELINLLLQTSTRELIHHFLDDTDLAMTLGQHVFFAPEEALRSQIVELFKQLLDMCG